METPGTFFGDRDGNVLALMSEVPKP